jgi:hypothetical protein
VGEVASLLFFSYYSVYVLAEGVVVTETVLRFSSVCLESPTLEDFIILWKKDKMVFSINFVVGMILFYLAVCSTGLEYVAMWTYKIYMVH